MGFIRFGLWLLLFSHPLSADSYWSHVPGFGSVQLTELNQEQHTALASHLKLSQEDATLWLDHLPAQLDALSCSTLDAQSQPLPAYVDAGYQVVSYAGVLRFKTDDQTKDTLWWLPWPLLPSLSQIRAELEDVALQVHQPLLLTEQDLKQNDQFILISGSSDQNPSYFALKLNPLHLPELLWSATTAVAGFEELTGAMAQPVLLAEQVQGPGESSLSLLLPNTGATEQKTLFYKVEALTGKVRGRLGAGQKVSDLSGALTVYDQNRDSISDSVVFSTKAGQVWQVQMENHHFYDMQPIADLSSLDFSDIQFVRTLYAAVPVGGSGSDFHSRRSQWLVLLGALRQQQSVLVLLKLQKGSSATSADLVDRTLPAAPGLAVLTDQDWQQIQQKNGWYSHIAGRLTQPPVVAAGVVYLSLSQQDPTQICSIDQASSALMALHLHHASSVYRQPLLPLEKTVGALVVKTNAQGGFSLIDQSQQQVLIDNLLEISPDCSHCSKPLQQVSFPRWQLMGTYHSEEGAYE
ncbi:MAG: hypothetical protein KJ556_12400 [Gammaproteobacteria bacterium]|nr:hypothetical protein [Gammaproteobacteria bacterium]MBU2059447.1 hypothetical protein [Gammaproteobacteria bacterium]MBU2175922.1 hypothetical protein [Gammaproteobacteria bacterium]MBU2246336.1 hypothetical protein [Gammaproteobacteria bacterium]MBU2346339.1 hypothetical protein [Gammaproteobacteria bacterium]